MTVFADYSRYYNLLYADKDYIGESDYVAHLIERYAPNARNLLDLGCGTGRHAALLAAKGFDVHGVDMSEAMLTMAASIKSDAKLSFSSGDLRSVRLDRKFDVVTSLFHVFCYQTSNNDLQSSFLTAYEHLHDGGILIFDCWYGPAVLTDRPAVRIKRCMDDGLFITRLAEPRMHANKNMVDVNYEVFIQDRVSEVTSVLRETHQMRYLFQPEIHQFISTAGFEMLATEEWMSGREPGFETWSVVFVVRK